MELRQLKYFVACAEQGSFSAAAKVCFVTQGALSQQMRLLEDELQTCLFDRMAGRVQLTEMGREFLPMARQTLQAADSSLTRLKDIADVKTGSLYIGATYGLTVLLTKTMQRFCPHFPGIRFNLRFERADELLKLLLERQIDFAMTYNLLEPDERLCEEPLFTSAIKAIVAPEHPLAKFKEVHLSQLKAFLTGIPAVGMNARTIIDDMLARNHVDLNPLVEFNEVYTMIHMVKECKMVAIMAESTIFELDHLVAVPIVEAVQPMRASLIYIKDVYQRRAVKEFVKQMKIVASAL